LHGLWLSFVIARESFINKLAVTPILCRADEQRSKHR
jgi:hypothetical protein